MKYFLLALSAICIITSCKKTETPMSQAQKLEASQWVPVTLNITYLSYTGGDSLTNPVWEKVSTVDPTKGQDTRPECIKDDYLKFKMYNQGDHITGGTKCSDNETDDIEFSWGLSDNDKKMYIYGLFSLLKQDANGLLQDQTDDKFVFAYPGQVKDADQKDITVRYTMTFNKK